MRTEGLTAISQEMRAPDPDLSRRLAERLLADLDALTDSLVGMIFALDDSYAAHNPVTAASLRSSCQENLSSGLRSLGGLPEVAEGRFAPARRTATARARQGVSLESVLQSYRLGGRVIWEALARTWFAPGVDAGPIAQLLGVATHLWTVIDEYSVAVSLAYRQEENLLMAAVERRRDAALAELLDGSAVDAASARRVSQVLDLDASGATRYVLLLVADVNAAEELLSAAASARGTVVVSGLHHGRQVAVVAAASSPSRRHPGSEAVTAGVVVSPAFRSLSDAGSAYRTARLAMRAGGARSGVWGIDEVIVEAIVLSAPDLARRLIASVITPLEEAGPDSAALLDTIAAILRNDGSLAGACSDLFIHRNTMTKRLRRIEELTGVGIGTTAHRTRWTMALAARELGLSAPDSAS